MSIKTITIKTVHALKKPLLVLLGFLLLCLSLFILLDRLWPLPVESFEQRHFAQVVVDKDGLPLRAFADQSLNVSIFPSSKPFFNCS